MEEKETIHYYVTNKLESSIVVDKTEELDELDAQASPRGRATAPLRPQKNIGILHYSGNTSLMIWEKNYILICQH